MQRSGLSFAVLGIALLVPLAAALVQPQPPISDAALFEYYGRALAHGSRLYIDLWDNKLPSIYAVNAAWNVLLGPSYVLHALAGGVVAAVAVGAFAYLLRRSGVAAWAPASLVLALLLCLPTSFDSVENIALPCILIGYALALNGRTAWAALAVAVATTFWVPSALMLIPLLDRERGWRPRLAVIATYAGVIAAYAVILLVVIGAPALAELVRTWVPYVLHSFAQHGGSGRRVGPLAGVFHGLLGSGVGVLLCVLAVFVRVPRDATQRFALLWTACSLVASVAPGNFFPHYFIPTVPACIFAVAAFAGRARVAPWRAAFAALALVAVWRNVAQTAGEWHAIPGNASERNRVGELVLAVAGPGAVIDVEPYEPGIYLAAGARGEDRFGMVPRAVRPAARPGLLAPALVVVIPDEGRYAIDPSAKICAAYGRWTIYVPAAWYPALAARCAAVASR